MSTRKFKFTKEQILKKYISLQKSFKKKRVVRESDMIHAGISYRQIKNHFRGLLDLEKEVYDINPDIYPDDHEPGKRHLSKEQVYKRYLKYRRKLKTMPKLKETIVNVCAENVFYRHYKNVKAIEHECRERNPEIFADVAITEVKNHKKVKAINKKIKNHQRFFVTTAITGCFVNEDFYASIKKWCKKYDAKLLILVAEDPAKQKTKEGEHTIDKNLVNDDDFIVVQDMALNSNIHLSTIKLSAKQIDATTGLDRLAHKGTFIYASPKQRLKPVPVSNTKHVHLLVTPGAITDPDYKSDMYMSLRTAYLAENDHVMGGVIVEIDEKEKYHFRHVQMDTDGSFIDLATRYLPNGKTKKEQPIGLQPGDWHTGSTDPMVKACIHDMCKNWKPKHLFMHDYFDGVSINHHIEKDRIELALLAEKGLLSLEGELELLYNETVELSNWDIEELTIVYSNHDDFLNRYLRAARYADPSQAQNHRISLKLALAALDKINPLEYALNELYGFDNQEKVNWLKLDQDFIIAGIQMGVHGHKGANGSHNPSIAGLERVYRTCNTGHTHSSEILRGAFRAGTSTYLKLGYNSGPSSWSQSHVLTHQNGSRQIIYTIDGKYSLDSKVKGYS